MDDPQSESDVTLSPTGILERLHALRQLQLLQQGKLHKQQLQYHDSGDTASSITEMVSHFSSSTSYNTFRSMLMSPRSVSTEPSPRLYGGYYTPKVKSQDLVDGVSILNLSQESDLKANSPLTTANKVLAPSKNETCESKTSSTDTKMSKKQISLDDMPILSPKQDFEALVIEKLKDENNPKEQSPNKGKEFTKVKKKPFLKRGEGMSRFGLGKNDLVIQNTKSLPWRQRNVGYNAPQNKASDGGPKPQILQVQDQLQVKNKVSVQVAVTVTSPSKPAASKQPVAKQNNPKSLLKSEQHQKERKKVMIVENNCELHGNNNLEVPQIQLPKGKHPLSANRGKTWAAILTKEQDVFLQQLKQSDYYKNFVSPAKSTVSEISYDEGLYKLRQERESAEQNMFELLENKVTHESFSLENSFFNRFLKQRLENSGESTPLIMQKCLTKNPELMNILPDLDFRKQRNDNSISETETCNSECTNCCDTCSSVSTCCSCQTVEEANSATKSENIKNAKKRDPKLKEGFKQNSKEVDKAEAAKNSEQKDKNHDDTVTETDSVRADMAEMNAKLVATSEILKERLQELEDEIETFRKENRNLSKMREEIDLERKKFYEEKSSLEQKFNEDKILSEYYLAEEKEKLTKQKQIYERYVKDMRGRLNKKEKDEVLILRAEINGLKEEIRIKDAKSSSTIARLRNQLKIIEKEKTNLQEEVEKLKKENRRIQHSNEITRRLTNVKYLEQINKKLSTMTKANRSEVDVDNDVKYKGFEIEQQSRSRRVQPQNTTNNVMRLRAKSVPNLKVTSRYAKYFSQRDSVSQFEKNLTMDNSLDSSIDVEDYNIHNGISLETESVEDDEALESKENNLEKIYMERFQSTSPKSNYSSHSEHTERQKAASRENLDGYFFRKSNSYSLESKSPNSQNSPEATIEQNTARTKSPVSILSNRSGRNSPVVLNHSGDSNKPFSILSNHSISSKKLSTANTIVHEDQYRDKLVLSPEPVITKHSLHKSTLIPTEMKRRDGSKELRFSNGNVKQISADGNYSKFVYYNGDVKENFFNEGRIKYYYASTKTYHTTHADGLEILEFPDGQVEKRYKDGSTEIHLPNGSIRYFDPKNEHVREEWRFPDGTVVTTSADGDRRVEFRNGQIEVHTKDHKRREFPDGTVKLVYNDGTSETRYASGRVRIKDKHGNLIMDSGAS